MDRNGQEKYLVLTIIDIFYPIVKSNFRIHTFKSFNCLLSTKRLKINI